MKIQFVFIKSFLFISVLSISFSNITNPDEALAAIVRTLSIGSVGDDVLELQRKLNVDIDTRIAMTGAGSLGQETNYFGPLTHAAVVRYQEKYREEILTPVGLAFGSGIVGPQTIKHLNRASAQNSLNPKVLTSTIPQTTQSTIVRITGISQSSGTNGDDITLFGEGFSAKNTVLIDLDRRNKYVDIASYDAGTKITFTLDTEAGNVINNQKKSLTQKQIDIWEEQFPTFIMPIRVETEYGISNPINFIYLID